MDKKALIEEFKRLSPYKNSIIRTPWDRDVVDVKEIHSAAFDKLSKALDSVKTNRAPLIFVLQGEPGSGKSHFLWRIARNAEDKKFLFVNIVPFISVKRVMFHTILENTIESLGKMHPNLRSRPIDHIIGYTLQEGAKLMDAAALRSRASRSIMEMIKRNDRMPYVAKSLFESIEKNEKSKILAIMARRLSERYTDYPEYFFTLLTGLANKEKEPVILELLKGEALSSAEAEKIGLDRDFKMSERNAFNILCSLVRFSPFPFIISIDQVETLDRHLSAEEIERFFENILSIYNNVDNSLFLLSVQTQTFKKWTRFLSKDILDRLSERTTILPLNLAQAKEIVKARNRYYFKKIGVETRDPYFPFTENQIELLYKKGNKNPRKLIKSVDYLLEKGELTEQKDSFENAFKNYLRRAAYSHGEFRREFTDLLLKITKSHSILKETPTYSIVKLNNTALAINNSKHSLYNCVSHIARFKRKKAINNSVLLRNTNLGIKSTAKKTNELLKKYKIDVKYYTEEDGRVLISVAKILRDTESGDLELAIKETENLAKKKIAGVLPKIAKLIFGDENLDTEKAPVESGKIGEQARSKKKIPAESKNKKKKSLEKKIEEILQISKVISYDKLARILKKDPEEIDAALINLEMQRRIKVAGRKYGEKWILIEL